LLCRLSHRLSRSVPHQINFLLMLILPLEPSPCPPQVKSTSYLAELPSSVEATGFTPQDLVEICVGTITAKVYTKILPTIAVFKCAHAFQLNKAALHNLQADLRLVFDAIGGQLNATSTVGGIYSNGKHHFNKHRHNFANLTFLSFHNLAGNQLNNNTMTNNP
jgi:hypothetical protein